MTAFPANGLTLVLLIPAVSAAILALMPGYKVSSRLNVAASFLTLVSALSLFWHRPEPGLLLHVDDLNIVFVVLNTFVGFTTSAFSASYISHELETGRLTPSYLRFYHAMYQALMFEMNLALVSNNLGLMWVGVEFATLTTVLMVGIYRTHEALEAAWKYFILGSVGIALALFGTILLYMAARPVAGPGDRGNGLDGTDAACGRLRSGPAQSCVRLPAPRLWNQGWSGAHARLAARCARRGTDADLGGAVGPAAQRGASRASALQNAARHQRSGHRPRSADGDDGHHLRPVRRAHALPAA